MHKRLALSALFIQTILLGSFWSERLPAEFSVSPSVNATGNAGNIANPNNVVYGSRGHSGSGTRPSYSAAQRRYLADVLPRELKAADCGKAIGTAQLQHYGRGLWSHAKYAFDVRFEPATGAFSYHTNYGLDVFEASIDPVAGSATYRKRQSEGWKEGLNIAALNSLEWMEQDLGRLERQMNTSPFRKDADKDVIACLHKKIQTFRNAVNEARKR